MSDPRCQMLKVTDCEAAYFGWQPTAFRTSLLHPPVTLDMQEAVPPKHR